MTAREFLSWALDEFDAETPQYREEALFALGRYLGKSGSYFVQFPDADVLNEDGVPLEESLEEPGGFQAYWFPF